MGWALLSRLISYTLIVLMSWSSLFLGEINCSAGMKRLYEDLFTDYNRLILPVANNKTKVIVTLNLKLGQILDLNLKQQILSTNVWVEQNWHDKRLEWNPEQYEGIEMIHVPAENIWIPDIVLFNNADGNYELTLVAKAIIYSNGTVVWKPPTMFRSTCEIDVEYFPFDIQTCFLRFGSWTYAGDELELRHVGNKRKVDIGIDLSQFYKNVEWDIIDVPAYYNEVYYECCSEPYPDITFKIVIRRKMLFYLVNLILPVALMTFMTVSVFYLPSDSNEKVTLSISILTSLIVFFLLMLEIIPASSLAVPLFGKYLLFTLVLVSLSACVSVYVLNLHHRSPSVHEMSPKVRAIFLKTLPRLLRLNRPDPREKSSLNRFRKKKIAQQMLNANNKIYDLTQPLATSLNLIETLHKSYDFRPQDDTISSTNKENGDQDDEGRYFRRYVDNYIERLKASEEAKRTLPTNGNPTNNQDGSEKHAHGRQRTLNQRGSNRTSSSSASKQLANCCLAASTNVNRTETSACPLLISGAGQRSQHASLMSCAGCTGEAKNQHPHHNSRTGMLNDDTLDMTFDYEDQEACPFNGQARYPASLQQHRQLQRALNGAELPSPPPPPRPLVVQLSDSLRNLKSGRMSSCSRNFTRSSSSQESLRDFRPDSSLARPGELGGEDEQVADHSRLVDKLISNINFISKVSDELDDTTSSSQDQCGAEVCSSSTQQRAENLHGRPINKQQQLNSSASGASFQSSINNNQNYQSHEHAQQAKLANRCTCEHLYSRDQAPTRLQEQHSNAQTKPAAKKPSELLLSLRLSYDQMPAHVRAAIRSILFIADTIKNEDDENSAIEDWESMSMVVDRLFLWIFFLLCTFGSIIILALAPSLYDQRISIDDKLRIDIPPSNCSASVFANE